MFSVIATIFVPLRGGESDTHNGANHPAFSNNTATPAYAVPRLRTTAAMSVSTSSTGTVNGNTEVSAMPTGLLWSPTSRTALGSAARPSSQGNTVRARARPAPTF